MKKELAIAGEESLISAQVLERLRDAEDVDKYHLQLLQERSPADWEEFQRLIHLEVSPAGADLTRRGEDDPFPALLNLARVKVVVPADNIEVQKDQHNITIENHIKLALETAGTASAMLIFLELALSNLKQEDPSEVLAGQVFLIWAPVAEMLGWYGLKTELEEAAFEVSYPKEKESIAEAYMDLGGDEALAEMVADYKAGVAHILAEEMPEGVGFTVSARKKSYYSVWRKCELDKADTYRLPDFFGIRVVIDSGEDEKEGIGLCYQAGDVLSQCFEPILTRYKDFIRNPKPNGYQSLHVTLRDHNGAIIEAQVRTSAMHDKAENDPNVSHLTYEATVKLTPGKFFREGLAKPHKIYAWREQAARRMQTRKAVGLPELKSLTEEVLVFSHDGNLYALGEGSTALDFAFEAHSDKALKVQSIVINGQPAQFSQEVKFGDVVEIIYHPRDQLTWRDSWHQRVTSGKARRRLTRAAKERDQEVLIAKARHIIEEPFKKAGIPNALELLSESDREGLARRFTLKSFNVLLREIGAGTKGIGARRVINRINAVLGSAQPKGERGSVLKPIDVKDIYAIEVQSTPDCNYHFAGCCQDILGQPIVARPSAKSGDFSIHSAQCANVRNDVRVLPCKWLIYE